MSRFDWIMSFACTLLNSAEKATIIGGKAPIYMAPFLLVPLLIFLTVLPTSCDGFLVQPSVNIHGRQALFMVSFPSPTPQSPQNGAPLPVDTNPCYFYSSVLGELRPIAIPGQDSFVGAMGVPTFAAIPYTAAEHVCSSKLPTQSLVTQSSPSSSKAWGLEGALDGLGPSMLIPNVLDPKACTTLIDEMENIDNGRYADDGSVGFGDFSQGKNRHGALQIVVSSMVSQSIAQQLAPHIDIHQVEELRRDMIRATNGGLLDEKEDVRLGFVGLNRRWRIYKYDTSGDETFSPHIDAGFPPSGISSDGNYLEWDITDIGSHDNDGHPEEKDEIISRLTVLMYLNEDFVGGETNFYRPLSHPRSLNKEHNDGSLELLASVRPRTGAVLLFPQGVGEDAVEYARQHWPLHEGSPVFPGSNQPKYVIRSDALFVTQSNNNDDSEGFSDGNDNEWARLSQYDQAVRKAFLPQVRSNTVWSPTFLSHVASLYNPHMGVENLGPFLYSFIRFTKQRQIMEIGAGYTSIWILQALKDNAMEMDRVKTLEDQGKCRLLDIPWTVQYDHGERTASLLCLDNCLHQKETATGAFAVAQSLGLDSFLKFKRGDAFEEVGKLQTESIDVLWCDFGVGSRILEFVAGGAWDSVRPGGFLVCHSTLTNENTRNWLEKVRRHGSLEETGMAPGSYTELSLLEPHKRFQNAVTILQKRQGSNELDFEEPIYSQYA